jgi:hypothetical protein
MAKPVVAIEFNQSKKLYHWSQFVIYQQIARIGHIQLANQQEMGRGGAFAT